jgi:aminopeptidase N
MKSLSFVLDEEFKRVAKVEDTPMGDLVAEIAELLGCTDRMLYNWRSGKWSLPSDYVPILCKRFKSTLLLDVLAEALKDQAALIHSEADLNKSTIRELSKDLVITALGHHQLIEETLKKADDLSKADVAEIEESNERVGLRFRYVLSLMEALYEQQATLRRKQA